AYLAQRFGAAQLPQGFAQSLHQRTNGNPFFLVTVVEELVRQGRLGSLAPGGMPPEDLAAVAGGVPEGVRQLIDAQLTYISPQEQEMLAAASVVGAEVSAAAGAAAVARAAGEGGARLG